MTASTSISHTGFSSKRRHFLRADRIFLATLICISLTLSGLSINYSRVLSIDAGEMYSRKGDRELAHLSQNNARESLLNEDLQVQNTIINGKYRHDRVYCMVPFIWNKEIYDVSKCFPLLSCLFCLSRLCLIHSISFQLCKRGARNATS